MLHTKPPSPGPPPQVTCGSTIKLAHAPSSFRLISTEVTYSRGSRQQSVTAQRASGDARAYFSVQGAPVSVLSQLHAGAVQFS